MDIGVQGMGFLEEAWLSWCEAAGQGKACFLVLHSTYPARGQAEPLALRGGSEDGTGEHARPCHRVHELTLRLVSMNEARGSDLLIVAHINGVPDREDGPGEDLQWDDATPEAAQIPLLALAAMLALQQQGNNENNKG